MIAIELDHKDEDLLTVAVRVLRVKNIRNLQREFIDYGNCRIQGFSGMDEAEKAMSILRDYKIPTHLVEQESCKA